MPKKINPTSSAGIGAPSSPDSPKPQDKADHTKKKTFQNQRTVTPNHPETHQKNEAENTEVPQQKKELIDHREPGYLPDDFTPPTLVKEQEKLGEGGSGMVIKGEKETGEKVAIKRSSFSAHSDANQREKALLAGLKHPNIVAAINHTNSEIISYREEDLEEGENNSIQEDWVTVTKDPLTLELATCDLLNEAQKELTEEKKIGYACDILSGISYLSAQGFCHQDIKPENVLIVDGKAKITDFDTMEKYADNPECISGTPEYRPYESTSYMLSKLISGKKRRLPKIQDPSKVDVWGAGITLAHLFVSDDIPEVTKASLKDIQDLYQDYDFDCDEYFDTGKPVKRDMEVALRKTQELYQKSIDDFFAKHAGRMSEEVRLILQDMLAVLPEKRISIEEASQRFQALTGQH